MREYDFIVLGTGISGLSFALKAAAHGRVAVLTKRSPEVSNTAWAQGGICCVADPQDSFNAHIADTVDAGAAETVLVVSGSSARMAADLADRPIDAAIVGIVDVVEIDHSA